MVATKNETVRSCIRKGFNFTKEGTDHIWFEYVVNGKRIALTCVSHGPDEDLTPYLLRKMGKDCHLSRQQFIAFAKCYMTEKQYRQILVDKGIIKGD
jgi:hypothetical protein